MVFLFASDGISYWDSFEESKSLIRRLSMLMVVLLSSFLASSDFTTNSRLFAEPGLELYLLLRWDNACELTLFALEFDSTILIVFFLLSASAFSLLFLT